MFMLNCFMFSNGQGGHDIAIHARNLAHARVLLAHFPIIYWQDFADEEMEGWHLTEEITFNDRKAVDDYDFTGKELYCLNFVG